MQHVLLEVLRTEDGELLLQLLLAGLIAAMPVPVTLVLVMGLVTLLAVLLLFLLLGLFAFRGGVVDAATAVLADAMASGGRVRAVLWRGTGAHF